MLNLLQALNRLDIPVAIGSQTPLVRAPGSTGKLRHGPNGLWFLGAPNDLGALLQDAVPGFYCAHENWEGATLIAWGPLTNVARAAEMCPETMRTLGGIVALGGAKFGGNITPVAEYNAWQDPEAFNRVRDEHRGSRIGRSGGCGHGIGSSALWTDTARAEQYHAAGRGRGIEQETPAH